jgi:hypothetical protein
MVAVLIQEKDADHDMPPTPNLGSRRRWEFNSRRRLLEQLRLGTRGWWAGGAGAAQPAGRPERAAMVTVAELAGDARSGRW